jgi:hypothetical protein
MIQSTATSVRASGQTGGTCNNSGPYKPVRNPTIVVFFKSGAKFPVDPVDGQPTVWTMVS